MLRHKSELILLIILIPILVYVGWQAYNTYLKPPSIDIEELEKVGIEEPAKPIAPPVVSKVEPPKKTPEPKGTIDYTGFIERDPLKPSLPVKEKAEKPPLKEGIPTGEIKKEPLKEIAPPTFMVTGIVWGQAPPRAIIDHQVYKIGDIVKGAKILDITSEGIHMIYEGKEFFVTIRQGG